MNITDSIPMEQLQDIVHRYCLSLTGSRSDAEDLAQDTWLKVIRLPHGLGHPNPEALLLRIAKTTWIDQGRRKRVLTRILHQEQAAHKKNAIHEKELGLFELERMFHALLQYLSPVQRAVFLLRDVFGYSIEETAHLLDTTAGAVKAAHHRARQSLGGVKQALSTNSLPLLEKDELKALLRALASAYASGDIELLLTLTLRADLEPAAAIGMIQNRLLFNKHSFGNRASNPIAFCGVAAA
ncbi:RNA polymerase sigma factor [Paenibacillus cremeus]|uniref:RNA polymerase sigma factor n=1 Tax=Paenibacillus cremeus TaxID=2163881 RepID=A0A559KGI9_9BACL|nr:RNA polymerase sigma factor [Paenibacillus cremeus]TVY11244.1 RNA polymerase sigma factor [Paenibacillus cremeus]